MPIAATGSARAGSPSTAAIAAYAITGTSGSA